MTKSRINVQVAPVARGPHAVAEEARTRKRSYGIHVALQDERWRHPRSNVRDRRYGCNLGARAKQLLGPAVVFQVYGW